MADAGGRELLPGDPAAVATGGHRESGGSSAAPCKEWEAGLASLHWVRTALDRQGRCRQRLVGVADGSYDTQGIWQGLPENTTLLVRCAKNRKLLAMPSAQQTGKPGRPKAYGPQLPTPQQALHPRRSLQRIQLQIRVGNVCCATKSSDRCWSNRCRIVPCFCWSSEAIPGAWAKAEIVCPRLLSGQCRPGKWHLGLPFPIATLDPGPGNAGNARSLIAT